MTTMCAVLGYGQSAGPSRQATPAATASKVAVTGSSSAVQRALLDQYCVTCHNDKTKKANLTLENLDLNNAGDHPELWEKVVRKLRAGLMPPPGVKRPPLVEYEGLRNWLETETVSY